MFLIFLSIEGVLFDRAIESSNGKFKYMDKNFQKYGYSEPNYSPAALSQVMVDLCSEEARANLDLLIKWLEDRGNSVGIVLFGSWVDDASTAELRGIFKQYAFSSKIIGRVDDLINLYVKGEYISSHDAIGEKIDVWLQTRKEELVINDYLILTDNDTGIGGTIPRLFKGKFINCPKIFGATELNAALIQLDQRESVVPEESSFRTAAIFNKLSIRVASQINGKREEMKFSDIPLQVSYPVRHRAVTEFSRAALTANQTEPLLLKWTLGYVPRGLDEIIADYDRDDLSPSHDSPHQPPLKP